MSDEFISHALVLPDDNFTAWYNATTDYRRQFDRVAVIRSPRGNDLNRYRNISAVQAPLTWFQDDAHAHIRRIYPSVVMVDVIRATTPQELQVILQQRVERDDRYGTQQNTPNHIYYRFVMAWATDHRPMKIVRPFDDSVPNQGGHEGIDILTKAGAKILSATDGRVQKVNKVPDALDYGQYVQVTLNVEGQAYIVTYTNLQNIKVRVGQVVQVGHEIGETSGDTMKIVLQSPLRGIGHFQLPNIIDPTPHIYIQDFRVRPLADGLRLRKFPNTTGEIIGQVYSWELLEALEMHGRALSKIDVNGQWVKVRARNGNEGYTAGWFLEATTEQEGQAVFDGANPVGVNLDAYHPQGKPDASRLGELGWVRFGYNVSAFRGSEDINHAFNLYRPLAERYVRAGYKVMFTTSHQTYGEGKIDFWPWNQMTDEKWNRLIPRFAEMMNAIARQWAGTGLMHVWQVWNEQDAPPNAVASAPMRVHNYTQMLRQVIPAIKSEQLNVPVITGGFTGGPGNGSNYARQAIRALPINIRPDGIAFHPYGRGVEPGPPYARFGHIDESVRAYSGIMPDKPLWITEWGVLDRPNDSPTAITKYALDFIRHIKRNYANKVAVMIWYAWSQGMHNGYGIVDAGNNPRPPFTDSILNA